MSARDDYRIPNETDERQLIMDLCEIRTRMCAEIDRLRAELTAARLAFLDAVTAHDN